MSDGIQASGRIRTLLVELNPLAQQSRMDCDLVIQARFASNAGRGIVGAMVLSGSEATLRGRFFLCQEPDDRQKNFGVVAERALRQAVCRERGAKIPM